MSDDRVRLQPSELLRDKLEALEEMLASLRSRVGWYADQLTYAEEELGEARSKLARVRVECPDIPQYWREKLLAILNDSTAEEHDTERPTAGSELDGEDLDTMIEKLNDTIMKLEIKCSGLAGHG